MNDVRVEEHYSSRRTMLEILPTHPRPVPIIGASVRTLKLYKLPYVAAPLRRGAKSRTCACLRRSPSAAMPPVPSALTDNKSHTLDGDKSALQCSVQPAPMGSATDRGNSSIASVGARARDTGNQDVPQFRRASAYRRPTSRALDSLRAATRLSFGNCIVSADRLAMLLN
jgi:hypothetical protein